jgi:NAD(P)-dependent dehydrogenase (short-subunit alcohol dehydrogenase family)
VTGDTCPLGTDDTGTADSTGFVAELSELPQVRGLAARVRDQVGALDVLLNNAGVYVKGDRQVSADGWESNGQAAYATSKLANELFSNALARRLDGTGTTSSSRHLSDSKPRQASCRGRAAQAQERLWDVSAKLVQEALQRSGLWVCVPRSECAGYATRE